MSNEAAIKLATDKLFACLPQKEHDPLRKELIHLLKYNAYNIGLLPTLTLLNKLQPGDKKANEEVFTQFKTYMKKSLINRNLTMKQSDASAYEALYSYFKSIILNTLILFPLMVCTGIGGEERLISAFFQVKKLHDKLATENKKQAMIMKSEYDFLSEIRHILAQLDLLDDKTQAHFNLIHGVFFKQPENQHVDQNHQKLQLKLL